MPVACLIAHDPDAQTALFLDASAFASCRRCGGGLVNRGKGWKSPLPWHNILVRKSCSQPSTGTGFKAMSRSV